MSICTQIIDGRALAQTIEDNVREQVRQLPSPPRLVVTCVGQHPPSLTYIKRKQDACQRVGITSQLRLLDDSSSAEAVACELSKQANDSSIHGMLLQLPLPKHLHAPPLLSQIPVDKDVDGFHPLNMGSLALREPRLRPCTPYGVMLLLQSLPISLEGKHVVVVGASNIVGRPMALEALLEKCTVTVCHRFTECLAEHVKRADILIAAAGKPNIIQTDWLKSGVVIIDVGFNHLPTGQVVGDVDFAGAQGIASWITPVPGGVGPMTVACLLLNTVQAAVGYNESK